MLTGWAEIESPARVAKAANAPLARVQRAPIRAGWEALKTTDDNRRLWTGADFLSADAATSAEMLRIARSRCRHEFANNSYCTGIALTIAIDTVGRGPRLQLKLPRQYRAVAQFIEKQWRDWTRAVGLAKKLALGKLEAITAGEMFFVKGRNAKLRSRIKLDVRLIDADRVTSPLFSFADDQAVDGIKYDEYDNPVEYHILKRHPGDPRGGTREFDTVPADMVLHSFRPIRAEQHRGMPEILPALPLFAELRRFNAAVRAAAETAADYAAVVYSDLAPDDSGDVDASPYDLLELEKRFATVLPKGWKLGQIEAQQPTTTHDAFNRTTIREILRCMLAPMNIGLGDSSGYNYSSARMDAQIWDKVVAVGREMLAIDVVDRIADEWMMLVARTTDWLPGDLTRLVYSGESIDRDWFWDGREHVDPNKEANAEDTQLRNRTLSYARAYAKRGLDWQSEFEQIAFEREEMLRLKLTPDDVMPRALTETPEDESDEEDSGERGGDGAKDSAAGIRESATASR